MPTKTIDPIMWVGGASSIASLCVICALIVVCLIKRKLSPWLYGISIAMTGILLTDTIVSGVILRLIVSSKAMFQDATTYYHYRHIAEDVSHIVLGVSFTGLFLDVGRKYVRINEVGSSEKRVKEDTTQSRAGQDVMGRNLQDGVD